ncbi:MAG: hypothetical protein HYX48_07720 [Chlamydiales bacterium]|nr:hypothetical protein [Chlamydiales bacterium]
MMIGVFTLYLLAMAFIVVKKRGVAIFSITAGLLFAILTLWYHATSTLNINL